MSEQRSRREAVRSGFKLALIIAVLVLVLPQCFVFIYYSHDLATKSGARLPFMRALGLYALTISWVSAPLIVALVMALRALILRRAHALLVLGVAVVSGFVWLILWNNIILQSFSYWRSVWPILLCALFFAGYGVSRRIYQDSLPLPSDTADGGELATESSDVGLSE